ncbi:heavy metal-binding domain-containing protein, partial [Bacillus thuringiensis]|uniref:heavy metal-binding domain-containing protein n=1 Tax=Bacillus thuringiensis TaxID=1428 RepID=UPI002840EAF8
VNGEAIMGANIVRDLFASVRDVVGGRAGSYESKLKEAGDIALEEMNELEKQKGGKASVGVDVDYEVVGVGRLRVAVSGTAVRI